ncbi:MAG: hypothetical protein EOP87_05700 [Verrucomicrobiaceae bacterium]|nr:MAG: hypothetical protein EOP87_05700 [Verrucomicrobiaceae bacterium]
MKNPWILPAAALALGAAGGFITGKGSSSADAAATASAEAGQRSRNVGRGIDSGDEEKRGAARAKNLEDAINTPGHSARIKNLLDFYSGLTPEQLAEEAKKLEGMPMSERIMASFLLFGRWAEVDPTAAMAHANTMGFAAGFVRPTILQSWASVDPENAAKYYNENPREFSMMGGPGPGGGNGASMIAAEWAKQDPQAALAWASSLSGGDKNRAMTSVIREIAMNDPKKAAEMAGSMDPAERGDAYTSIARSYGAKNFGEAEIWVRSLPADEQGAAMASALEGLSQTSPDLAWTKAQAMADGDDKNRALRNVLENLAKQNSTAALKQLSTLTPEQQERSIGPVIQNLAVTDNVAAIKYVQSLDNGPVRDRGIQEVIQNDRKSAPADLISLAETITDEGDRNRTVGMAAMRWMREDEAAAKNYIQTSASIPDNMKQRMLDGGGRWGGRGPRR